jgi:hypothetical protein
LKFVLFHAKGLPIANISNPVMVLARLATSAFIYTVIPMEQ